MFCRLREVKVSEGHTSAAVAQHAGQDASVQLVELHQLQQICEPGLAVVHAEVEAALIFALWCGQRAGQRAVPGGGAAHGASNRPPFLVQGKRRSIVGLQVTDPWLQEPEVGVGGVTHW